MRRAGRISLALTLLGAACGGAAKAPATDPLAPTGLCLASATPTSDPPYAVTFQFRNNSATPMFLLKNCGGYDFGISSCASGFTDRLNDWVFCACSCDNPSCGNTCGGCAADEGTQIVGGDSLRRPFGGQSTTVMPSSCVSTRNLPAGRYRVSIKVYDSSAGALARSGPRVVSRDFELPAPDGLVDVPLAPSPDDVCDATPAASVAACTGAEAHDVPCALAAGLDFGYDGGLTSTIDDDMLVPPATFTRTRTRSFSQVVTPPLTCSAPIPRCARDARVVTTGDIVRALAQPGLSASFGASTPVFGRDPRPVDGVILVVRRPDGTSVGIGDECSDCARPLTPALQTLRTVLLTASDQQLTDPACAALAPPASGGP